MTRLYVVVLYALMTFSTVIGLECYRWTSRDYEIIDNGGWKKEDARRLCKKYNYVFAPDESSSDQKCGSCWCCKPKPTPVYSYDCKEGCCVSYGEDIIGTSKDMEKACSNDHPRCRAYSYSVGKGMGNLCKSSYVCSRCRSRDYKTCHKGNIPVVSRGSYAIITAIGSIDFDNDGIIDPLDDDDDNDGIPDDEDNDDDNDGIPDTQDKDDDNDGFPDWMDIDIMSDGDLDDDGVPDVEDIDDDNDSIPDALDNDDDNDGIPDHLDDYNDYDYDMTDMDTDGDYIPDKDDPDIDGDGILNVDDEDYSEYNFDDGYNWQNWLIAFNDCKNKRCGEFCSEGVCDGEGFCVRSEFNPCAVNGCDGKKCGRNKKATRKDTPQTSTERNLSTTNSYPNPQVSSSSPSATLSSSSTDQTLATATSPQISTTPDIKGCNDRFDFCKRPSIQSLCDSDTSIRKNFCRKSCKSCDSGGSMESCKNNWTGFWCTVYQFECSKQERVRNNCRKTCDMCF